MENEKNHEDRRTDEGKDFTLGLEHTMDMNENHSTSTNDCCRN